MNKYLLLTLLMLTGGANAMPSEDPSILINREGIYQVVEEVEPGSIRATENELRYKCGDTWRVVVPAEGLCMQINTQGNKITIVVSSVR